MTRTSNSGKKTTIIHVVIGRVRKKNETGFSYVSLSRTGTGIREVGRNDATGQNVVNSNKNSNVRHGHFTRDHCTVDVGTRKGAVGPRRVEEF